MRGVGHPSDRVRLSPARTRAASNVADPGPADGADLATEAVVAMKTAALVQLGYLAAEAGIALSLIPVTELLRVGHRSGDGV
ncbi:hypothetical protein AB0C52_19315 [Streptomyces sp. NPDC048717]|uniref:hypothetical protein n=1 Tax=Streptomyces sp. NPDC048717 TaxID=3154928 RepID=UPI00343174B3